MARTTILCLALVFGLEKGGRCVKARTEPSQDNPREAVEPMVEHQRTSGVSRGSHMEKAFPLWRKPFPRITMRLDESPATCPGLKAVLQQGRP